MRSTGAILTSDCLPRRSDRHCFDEKRHYIFRKRPFLLLICDILPFAGPEKTRFSRVTAADLRKERAGGAVNRENPRFPDRVYVGYRAVPPEGSGRDPAGPAPAPGPDPPKRDTLPDTNTATLRPRIPRSGTPFRELCAKQPHFHARVSGISDYSRIYAKRTILSG